MSSGVAITLPHAATVAAELVSHLAPACGRIEVAGSIRRRKPEVHDLEIVAIPRAEVRGGLWGDADTVNLLDEKLQSLRDSGLVSLREVEVHRSTGEVEIQTRDGASYKALTFNGLPVDLFITDPDQWGCIFAIRTGPGDWNQRLVTECKQYMRRVEGGRVLHLGRPVPTPEEADFFRAMGVPWLDPWDRSEGSLRFDRAILRESASA